MSVTSIMLDAAPVGSILQGAIADQIGLRVTMAGAAALMFANLVLEPHRQTVVVDVAEIPKSAAGPAAGRGSAADRC